jgi:2,5-diketo-D-gluconate reductase A
VTVQALALNIPIVGYGVFQIQDSQECTRCVIDAIHSGYRLIDTCSAQKSRPAIFEEAREHAILRECLISVVLRI